MMVKPPLLRRILRPIMRLGVMLAEGEAWRAQRRAMSPIFAQRALDALVPVIQSNAQEMCSGIAERAGTGEVDMLEHSTKTTFRVIREIVLGEGSALEQRAIDSAFVRILSVQGLLCSCLPDSDVLSSGWRGWPGLIPEVRALMVLIEREIASQAAQQDAASALLQELTHTQSRPTASNALAHDLVTLLVAGFDTTAVALSWATYLTTFDDQIQGALFAEAKAMINSAPSHSFKSILNALPLTRAVVLEALRLYPPAAILARTAVQSMRFDQLSVNKGDLLVLSVYGLHRHPGHWERPEHFDPRRFMSEDARSNPAFIPFGGGPRVCIGQHLAELELMLFLSHLISKFRFRRVTGQIPSPVMTLTLRPEGGVWLHPDPRSG
jgi:cytochrome P450